ncbi:MAG: ABC transporter permease [Planctomycetota bacterium]|jgi:ABC-2 type transport system permease protein
MFAKTWKELRWMAFTYLVILEAMLVPAILLWPNLREEMPAIGRLMPFEFAQRIIEGISSRDDSAAYLAYMAVQAFFKGVNVMGIAAAVLFGTGLIARERECQSLEFLLARPISRSRILAGKFLMAALLVVVPIFLVSWSAIPWSTMVEERLPFWELTLASMHSSLFVLSILGFTVICSVVARSQVQAAFAVGIVVISQVTIYFIQEIRVASIFRLSDFDVYGPIMAGNLGAAKLFGGMSLWLAVSVVVLYLIADRLFRKADL